MIFAPIRYLLILVLLNLISISVFSQNTTSKPIEFEAITGITPRVGASAFSSSEGVVIRDGSGSVFAHNRQFIHSQMDMSVAGKATSLSFVRTYRSGVNPKSGLGYGWDHNFNVTTQRILKYLFDNIV
jgi:hypothetical protein